MPHTFLVVTVIVKYSNISGDFGAVSITTTLFVLNMVTPFLTIEVCGTARNPSAAAAFISLSPVFVENVATLRY